MTLNLPRLLALDLDGTVLDHTGRPPEKMVSAISACHQAGIKLAFLTGRRPRTARIGLDIIGLPALVATNSGCLLWEYPDWKQLERRMFPPEMVQDAADLLAPHSANLYVDASRAGFEFIHLDRQPTPEFRTYLRRYGKNTLYLRDERELANYEITQIALPGPDDVIYSLKEEAVARFNGNLLVLAVRWPLLPCLALELFGPQSHKGAALEYFARKLGIAREDCLAAGDDVNDISMLKWAGTGVAMPHASVETKNAADVILDGNAPESLADYLMGFAGG